MLSQFKATTYQTKESILFVKCTSSCGAILHDEAFINTTSFGFILLFFILFDYYLPETFVFPL